MFFSQIQGLDEIKEQLVASVENQHVAHAQLFAGGEGGGALALALAFANYINCENKQGGNACGECAVCQKTKKHIHPDYHFIFPTYTKTKKEASNKEEQKSQFLSDWRVFLNKNPYPSLSAWADFSKADNRQCNISIEESRRIIKDVSMKAFEAEYKVFFMWLPEYMNEAASNALLKVLEEPPHKTLFFLVTQSLEQVLPTILSRTQIVNVRPFTEYEVQNILINQFYTEAPKARNLALWADGNVEKALSLGKEKENDSFLAFKNWMRHAFMGDFTNLVKFSDEYQKLSKVAQKSLLTYAENVIRELLLFHHGASNLLRMPEEERTFLEGFAKAVKPEHLEDMYAVFEEALIHIERNINAKMISLDVGLQMVKLFRKK
ncbi:MAG: DNA polymerase III subunit delta' [Cytophagales bacterium]|nr:DNA polymerase III subunit delta' [Cytophagales bacterium]